MAAKRRCAAMASVVWRNMSYDSGIDRKLGELTVETPAGVLPLELFISSGMVEKVKVNMGMPRLRGRRFLCLAKGTGW